MRFAAALTDASLLGVVFRAEGRDRWRRGRASLQRVVPTSLLVLFLLDNEVRNELAQLLARRASQQFVR
jgi:hypothetical protein